MADDGTAARWRRLAADLTRRVEGVPEDGWDRPAPCEGWVARDVVRHLVEWMPGLFLGGAGLPRPAVPPVQDDPAAAWRAVDEAVQAALDDPATAARRTSTQAGDLSLAELVAMTGLTDLLVHTWDLARATGQDEALDPDEVVRAVAGTDALDPSVDAAMRDSGHFGPRTPLGPGASAQDRLLAFMGRRP